MKAQILKIAGVKNEAEFYKKYPTEEAFMKKHGKQLEKAQNGIKKKFTVPQMTFNVDTTPQGLLNNYYNSTKKESIFNTPYEMGKSSNLTTGETTTLAPISNTRMAGNILLNQAGTLIGLGQTLADKYGRKTDELNNYEKFSDMIAKMPAPKMPKPKYVRPEYSQVSDPQKYGVPMAQDGASIGGNPTEIQNTYDPYDIYTALGYEPLNDSNPKKYAFGGDVANSPIAAAGGGATGGLDASQFMGAAGSLGGALGSTFAGDDFAQTEEGQLGSTLGGAAGFAIGGPVGGLIGSGIGGLAGGLIGGKKNKQMKFQKNRLESNLAAGAYTNSLQNGPLSAYAKDGAAIPFYEEGGYMNPEYNPQVIAKFGEYDVKDLLKPPHDADMLRAGGHLKEYTPPSASAMYTGRDLPYQMKDGGEVTTSALNGAVKTTWGGGVKTLSHNPYMPGTGETIQFVGNSHDTYDPKSGNTGIGVKYGEGGNTYADYAEYGTKQADANVEVEKEPAVELPNLETGENTLNVYGALRKPGTKESFKNYITKLSKTEAKQNKIIEKNTDLIDNLDVTDQFDKLTLNTGQANLIGANMKLKDIAIDKMDTAAEQNAILDTAKEFKLDAGALAKGKVKPVKPNDPYAAEFGVKLEQFGPGGKKGKTASDPDNAWINKIFDYEIEHGSSTGKGLSNFGYNSRNPKTREQALKYFKQDYLPKVKQYPLGLRERIADYMFNTGRSPKDLLLYAAGKISLDDINSAKTFDKEWKENAPEIQKMYSDPSFINNLDQAKLNVYRTTKQGTDAAGNRTVNPAFDATWKNRVGIFGTPQALAQAPVATPKQTSAPINNAIGSPLEGAVNLSPIAEMLPDSYLPEMSPKALAAKATQQFVPGEFIPGISKLPKQVPQPFDIRNFLPKGVVPPKLNDAVPPFPVTYSDWDPSTSNYFGPEGIGRGKLEKPTQAAAAAAPQVSAPPVAEGKKEKKKFPWETILTGVNSMLPYLRPTNQMEIDPSQLSGEMLALATNQVEPVYAQSYQPQLTQPFSVSLQDMRNQVIADARAAQRMAQGNPAAAAMIAAGSSEAINKINAEEFRANQSEQARVAELNRQTLNDAQMKNLAIFQDQAGKMSQARSNTKQQAIAALNSMNDKILKNKLENRQLGIAENLYNYRFTPNGVAYNVNPLAQFAPYGSGGIGALGAGQLEPGKDFSLNRAGRIIGVHNIGKDENAKNGKKISKADSKNSSIVKAIKGL